MRQNFNRSFSVVFKVQAVGLPAVAITFRVLDIVQTGPVLSRWRQSSRGVQLTTRLCLEQNSRMRRVLFICFFVYSNVPR